jgi:glutamine amidotransferase
MWHARYATHGVKNEYNCHPFQVGDDTQTYLAHNGVLDTFIEKGDKRSDTRVFAEDTLPKLGGVSALNDENIYRMVTSWASGSKIAILSVNPDAEYQLYLINEKSGTWDDNGVWWSNSSYKRTTYDYTPSVRQSNSIVGYSDDDATYWEKQEAYYNMYATDPTIVDMCPMCDAMISLDESETTCEFCASCLSCFQLPMDCDCYDPSNKAHSRGFDFDNEWSLAKNYDSLLI